LKILKNPLFAEYNEKLEKLHKEHEEKLPNIYLEEQTLRRAKLKDFELVEARSHTILLIQSKK